MSPFDELELRKWRVFGDKFQELMVGESAQLDPTGVADTIDELTQWGLANNLLKCPRPHRLLMASEICPTCKHKVELK